MSGESKRRRQPSIDAWSDPRLCLCDQPVYSDPVGVVRDQETRMPHHCPLARVAEYPRHGYVRRLCELLAALARSGPCRCGPSPN